MRLLRLVVPILILGAVAIFALENWSPTVPLVILASQTVALPLALWIIIACGLGMVTTMAIALCLRILALSPVPPSQSRRPLNPDSDFTGAKRSRWQSEPDPTSARRPNDAGRESGANPTTTRASREQGTPQVSPPTADNWEEFSRPKYEWEDWQPRTNQARATTSPAPDSQNQYSQAAQSPWGSHQSQRGREPGPRVTEVEFESAQPSASRFATQPRNYPRDYAAYDSEYDLDSDTTLHRRQGDRTYTPDWQEADPEDYRNASRDDYDDGNYGDSDYRNRDYGSYENDAGPDFQPLEDEIPRNTRNRSVRSNTVRSNPVDKYENDKYENDEYENDQYYPDQAPYRDYDAADYGPEVYGPNRDQQFYYDGEYRHAHYEATAPTGGDGVDPAYRASPKEQFIMDYGDEVALDAFDEMLSQPSSGQYRWKRPSTKDETAEPFNQTYSAADIDDLSDLEDWDDEEEDDNQTVSDRRPSDQDISNGSINDNDGEKPRPIREVLRTPIATQQSGSIYSYSYRRDDPTPDEQRQSDDQSDRSADFTDPADTDPDTPNP